MSKSLGLHCDSAAKYLGSLFVKQWIDLNSLKAIGSPSMDKGLPSSLFVNDGSFMERFKQLQQEKVKQAAQEDAKPEQNHSGGSVSNSVGGEHSLSSRPGSVGKATVSGSGGKLAFSLRQKSKVVAASVKLSEDEEEDERGAGEAPVDGSAKRRKLCQQDTSEHPSEGVDVGNYCLCGFLMCDWAVKTTSSVSFSFSNNYLKKLGC